MASVLVVLMIAMSSTIPAVWGNSSLSHAPDWPCWLNLKMDLAYRE